MSNNIIQFSTAARPKRKVSEAQLCESADQVIERRRPPLWREGRPPLPPPATETAKNSRLRIARRDAWWHAGHVTDYWRARLDWYNALETAQLWGVADSASFPSVRNMEGRWDLIDKWREVVVKQLLTPAPDIAAVNWKRAKLKSGNFSSLPIKRERVEQAIAQDVAFLEAHPTKTKRRSS